MTMPYSPSRATFQGNGVATTFPFSFKVWSTDQLTVTVTTPDATYTEEDVTAQCAITLTESGGTVTYTRNGAPLPVGYTLAVSRNMPFVQEVDLVSASRFDPQVIEDALDQAAAERQQLREGLDRVVKVPATSSETPEDVVGDIYAARDNAAASATAANASATNAAASETAAAASASTASAKASEAVTSATNAATSKTDAATSASTASTKASAAAASATAAAASATAANASATNAAASETAAAASATAAESAADRAEAAANAAESVAEDVVLAGSILTFSGSFGGTNNRYPIPRNSTTPNTNWVLCDGGTDGSGGTVPDLRGRMILGANDTYTTGSTGGALTHNHTVSGTSDETTLTVAQLASHNHTYYRPYTALVNADTNGTHYADLTQSVSDRAGGNASHTHTILIGSASSSSLPPYYALAYIIKL